MPWKAAQMWAVKDLRVLTGCHNKTNNITALNN